jgi:hypothetical protein
MKIEIKNRFTSEIIFSCEAESMKIAVKMAIETHANLSRANLSWASLSGADLSGADLSRANLSRANLSGANLDYSSWPLLCGSKSVKIDVKIAAQLAAHFCAVDCEDPEYLKAKAAILEFAKTSHHAEDLGI